MGIITTNSRTNVKYFFNAHGFDMFSFITTTSRIREKSQQLKTIKKSFASETRPIFYIGDETRDIEAARKAGVTAIAVTWGYNSHEILQAYKPDHLVHSPKELLALCRGVLSE